VTGPWLCFDTATEVLSAAVLGPGGELLSEVTRHAPRLHSALLIPTIDEALRIAGLARTDISVVAANRGPGSYTGLRIGLAALEALRDGLGIPAYGVPGLIAAASAQAQDGLVAPVLDARREDAFCALYEVGRGALPRELLGPALRTLPDFCSQLRGYDRPVLFLGDALRSHRTILEQCDFARLGAPELRAADLGRFAQRAREEATIADALSTAALYLRPAAVPSRRDDR
jgi:tRNA threonylcarbamoyladenosine biosynthesis protein TsaB